MCIVNFPLIKFKSNSFHYHLQAQVERDLQISKQKEIEKLEKDVEILENFEKVLNETVEKFKPYEVCNVLLTAINIK